jgi:prepilin-type N-terminal cleavage/methylation domain-containing protein
MHGDRAAWQQLKSVCCSHRPVGGQNEERVKDHDLQRLTEPWLQSKQQRRGFTLIELLVVIGIIAVLAGLLFPAASAMRVRAQRVQCTANLRNLYLAANVYVQQKGSWPQISMEGEAGTGFQDYARAWIVALAPFGPTQQTWICPRLQALLGNPDLRQPDNVRVDYYGMAFDDKPTSPYEWPRQPWFIERADVHGNGNLIVFTDGSISDLKTVIRR